MKQCPRCSAEITSKMKKCDKCGMPLDGVDFSDEIAKKEQEAKQAKIDKKNKKIEDKKAKKQAKKEKRLRESVSDTDFKEYALGEGEKPAKETRGLLGGPRRGSKNASKLNFDIDENGEYNISTSDVEIVGAETGKIIDEQYTKNYSVKKARGDYRPPKIKWWEIYKFADRAFAKRKIKKEVNKAAKIKPSFIKKTKLLLLSIFFGWCGAQNFYAKNYKKGWFQLLMLFVSIPVIFLGAYVPFFRKIEVSVGGFGAFINLFFWISDTINICFNSFRYRIQREGFIFALNIETRAKLGEKYIDLDLYKKPWWVRFKVWCQKKKRGYEEWKHDRRQRLIEKEKAKLAKAAEKAAIEEEIARHDAIEDAEIEKQKQEKLVVDKKTLEELKSFGDEDTKVLKAETKETEEKPKTSKPKTPKAKFSSKTSSSKKSTKNTTKKK